MELMRFLPVRALPLPEESRYLFSFDFDDTLFTLGGPAGERRSFFRLMRALRARYVESTPLICRVSISMVEPSPSVTSVVGFRTRSPLP